MNEKPSYNTPEKAYAIKRFLTVFYWTKTLCWTKTTNIPWKQKYEKNKLAILRKENQQHVSIFL